MLLRGRTQGVFLVASGPNGFRLATVAPEGEETILRARFGTMMMLRRVEVSVIWRLRRPDADGDDGKVYKYKLADCHADCTD